jgi:hypothetical protein
MKTTKFFFMAALALMTAACSNSDNDILAPAEQPAKAGGITITAKLAPKSGASGTRKLTDQSTYIKAEWAVDEHLAILYSIGGDPKVADARITDVDGTGAATITFTVVGGTPNNTTCQIIYPFSAAKDDKSGVKDAATLLANQDGTLLNASLDVRVGAGKIQTTSPSLDVTTQPVAQFAIFKFTVGSGGSLVAVNNLVVTIGSQHYTITSSSAKSELYSVLPAVTDQTVSFAAPGYTFSKDHVTFEAGKYYRSTLAMTAANTVDLASKNSDYVAQNGEILTGTLSGNYKIFIADGATVTLRNVSIIGNNTNEGAYKHAGIACPGDAVIILDGTNTVKGFWENYPGIHVAQNKTLTIQGTGYLNASSNGYGCGIGAGYGMSCGNIIIGGGTIEATGGNGCAAIGGSQQTYSCGDIVINGGNITAKGGFSSSGIGGGNQGKCGNITITGGNITSNGKQYAAGIGSGSYGECGNITISGGTIDATGNYGPGIGSGHQSAKCGDILISGGDVKTKGTGGNFTGLGCGYNSTCGSITVTDGTTKLAIYGDIGKGTNGASCGTVTIDGNEFSSTSQTFPHYTTSTVDGYWILTHK